MVLRPRWLGLDWFNSPLKSHSKSVLHVPKLHCNLISINKLTHDNHCFTKFFPNVCVFQALGSRKKISSVEMCSGLYLLKIPRPRKASLTSNGPSKSQSLHKFNPKFVFNSSVNKDSEAMLWHYRLGHPNFTYLDKLFSHLFIIKI